MFENKGSVEISLNAADKKLKILHLEDVYSDVLLIHHAIKKGKIDCTILVVDTKQKFKNALRDFVPDIVLADHSLPSFNSHEALTIFRESGLKIPFILITATVSDEFAAEISTTGADDYILKDRLHRLPAAIRNALSKIDDQIERQSYLEILTNNEHKFRTLIENSVDGMAILSEEGKPIYVSPSIKNVLGYTQEEGMKLDLLSIAHPDDKPALFQIMMQSLNNPGIPVKGGSIRMLHKDKSWRWTEGILTNMLHDPAINGIVDNFRDVTETKIAEESLKQSEYDLQAIFNSTSEAFILTDKSGVIKSLNRKAREFIFLNTDRKISAGDSIYQLIHFSGRKNVRNQMSKVVLGDALRYDHFYSRKNGETKWFEFNVNPVYNANIIEGISISFGDITERKQMENSLKESEFRYRQIVETAQEGIWMIDAESKTTFVNQKMADILGYTVAEMIGHTNFIFKDEEGLESAIKNIERTKQGFKETYESSFISKDGSLIWTQVSSNPIFADSGDYQGSLCMISDITERKASEEEVRKLNEEVARSEKFFKGVIESSADMITIIDISGNTIYASPEVSKKFGYTNEECLNLRLEDIIHPEDEAIMRAHFGKVMMNPGLPMEGPMIRNLKKDGSAMWVSGTVTNFLETEGINAIVANFRDITEWKLVDEKNTFRANLLNTISQAAIATNMNGIVNYWNKAAENIYGWTEHEAIGRDIMILTPSQASLEQAEEIMDHLKAGTSWTGEFRVRGKEGIEFPALISNSPIYDENSELTGIIGISSDITEKKELEALLDKANNLARIGSYEVDLIKNTLYWSAITRQIHEVEPDFVPDVSTALNFYKEGTSRDMMTKAVNDAIEHHIACDLELEIVTALGNEKWVNVKGEAICVNGKCIKLYGSIQDIDKVKKAEFEILKGFEERHVILESIGDAFFAVDKNWIVTYWNNHAEKNLAVTKSEIVGRNLWDVFTEGVQTSYQQYNHAMQTGKAVHFEDFFEPLGKWLSINAYPSKSGLSVYFQDITEQKKAEIKIRKSEFRYRQIVETAQEGIWVLDKDTNTLFINQKMSEIIGYSYEEIIGKPVSFLFGNDATKDLEQLQRRKKGMNEIFETQLITKSEERIWVHISANPIFDEFDLYNGALAMITDITARKNQEIQIQKNAQERELLIGELSRSLKDLKEFSFITSHNFRAPLSNLVGLLSVIDYDSLTESNKEIVELFKTSTYHLDKTINDLIKVLIIRNNVGASSTQNNIGDILNEVLLSLTYIIEEADCVIDIELDEPVVLFNRLYLESIIMNLLTNAIKYRSPNRKAQITISTKLDDGGKFVLIISDNGIGIDLKRHGDKIFGLYQRFHTLAEGEGLGLFIVKSHMTALGGSIRVESEIDKGTSFILTFK